VSEKHPADHAGPILGPVLRMLTNSEDPGGAVYGMLTCGAVMAAESRHADAIWRSVLGICVIVVMYWTAHSYAAGISRRLRDHVALSLQSFRRDLRREIGVVQGALLPILTVSVAGLVGATPRIAIDLGLWVVALSLIAYEVVAGLAIGLRRWPLLGQAGVGAAMALGIVAVKALLG